MSNTNASGIRPTYLKTADQLFTSNVVLASILLGNTVAAGNPANGIPIAASQRMKIRYWVKVTVGATGGIRFQVAIPAAPTIFQLSYRLNNTVAPSATINVQQTTNAVVTNALANAGTHWLEIEVYIRNGTTAGTIDLQMAQNTSDALTLTILEGASAEATIF